MSAASSSPSSPSSSSSSSGQQQQPLEPRRAQQRVHGTLTSSVCTGAARTVGHTLWLVPRLYLFLRCEFLFCIFFSIEGTCFWLRNFYLWFVKMGLSCGFSRGNIAVLLLLLLEGKTPHLQLYQETPAGGAGDEVGAVFHTLHVVWMHSRFLETDICANKAK